MRRSELIAILQKQTEEHERDGEVEIHVYGQCDDPEDDPIVMVVLSTNVASGNGEAISIIDVGRGINEYPEDGEK